MDRGGGEATRRRAHLGRRCVPGRAWARCAVPVAVTPASPDAGAGLDTGEGTRDPTVTTCDFAEPSGAHSKTERGAARFNVRSARCAQAFGDRPGSEKAAGGADGGGGGGGPLEGCD